MTGYTLTWRFDASPERVFRAWTEPDLLGWFFNPSQPTPEEPVEVDLRVGGTWRQRMIVDDDTAYATGGVYREVDPPRRLAFAFGAVDGWPALDPADLDASPQVAIDLVPDGDGTQMTLTTTFPEGYEPHPYMRQGWIDTVDRLAADLGGRALGEAS
jgi:uncharacterized protein YndB with AHSA1/START domain